jgi:uroporphyrinogen-III decarboxylase
MSSFAKLVAASPRRLALPIAVYPGAALTGATVRDIVTNPRAQVAATLALRERCRLPAALTAMDLSVKAVLCGNLDPTAVFVQATAEELAERTRGLLEATRARRNFVISSGCDVPATAPLSNLDRFIETVGQG